MCDSEGGLLPGIRCCLKGRGARRWVQGGLGVWWELRSETRNGLVWSGRSLMGAVGAVPALPCLRGAICKYRPRG